MIERSTRRRRTAGETALALAVTALTFVACSSSGDDSDKPPSCSEPISSFKELLIVEESVLTSPRASNAKSGVWSFRHAIENMMPAGASGGEFARRWLEGWVSPKVLNGFPLDPPNEDRSGTMTSLVLCPWLKRTPANECDATCGTCKGGKELDLALAPFRLIGIVNRMELRDTLEDAPNGEGRLVFGLTDGPADDPGSKPLAMTIIFEYFLPETRTAKAWAEAWHSLGKLSDGEAFEAGLEQVTNGFVKRDSRKGFTSAINGSAIAQIRTNESALNWIWQLREFGLGADGYLALQPTWNTPAEQLNGTTALRDFLVTNQTQIREKKHVLPLPLRAGSSDARRFSWSVNDVEPMTLRVFAENTCNGCHSSSTNAGAPIDTAFHLSPFRLGKSRVSQFMYNPDGMAKGEKADELTTRASYLRSLLCSR